MSGVFNKPVSENAITEKPVPVALRGNIKSIQVLRGISALLVMAYHLAPHFDVAQVSVDLFFIISGFIMGTIGVGERPGDFLGKRIARIAPLYWLVTGIMCVGQRLGLFHNFTFDARRLFLSLFFVPYFNENGLLYPLLVPGWTLNYEVFFYFIFAVGLLVKRPVQTTLVALALLTAIGVIFSPHTAIGLTWTSPLLLDFLAGLLLSQVQTRLPGAAIGLALMIAGIVVLGLSVPIREMLGGDYRLATWGIPAFAVVSGGLMIEYGGRWPEKYIWPLQKLGDVSYSLYLVHTLMISIGHRFLGTDVLASLMIVGSAIIVAFGSFHFVEKPLGKWARGLLTKLPGISR